MKRKGVIYILTNPAFPQYVKIECVRARLIVMA